MSATQQRRERDYGLDQLRQPTLLREFAYVNGQWLAGSDDSTIAVYNPANQAWLGSVASLTAEQSMQAVKDAQQAYLSWCCVLPQQRSRILHNWFQLIQEHKQDLALLITLEQGKPISEALAEIDYAASFVEFFAEEAKRLNIESVMSHLPNAEMEVWREPIGVAGLIIPWNFPVAMLTRKAGAALATGCSVIVHPCHETPFSALALAQLAEQAGMPPGVFNVISGHASTVVAPWMHMPEVRIISFTGSTDIGRLLYRQSADTIKRLVLELGGHAPFIVFADANIERAVDCAISAKFATSGQDCLAANRFFIERPVYEPFCQLFSKKTAALSVGPGIDDPAIGPLINEQAMLKQQLHIEDALAKGARLLTGGSRLAEQQLYFQPTVLADVSLDALIFKEETFGPVAALTAFDQEADVIELANSSEYGLISYVHSENAHRIYRLTRALQSGMVAVNRTKVTGAPIPFGGMKQSGIGREGARLGMEAYTEVKYVCRDYEN